MIEQQGLVFVELQLLGERLLVHGHPGHGGKTEGCAGETDVLRYIAGIYGSHGVGSIAVVAELGAVAYENKAYGSNGYRLLASGNGRAEVLVAHLLKRIAVGNLKPCPVLGAYIYQDVLGIDGRGSGDLLGVWTVDAAGSPKQFGEVGVGYSLVAEVAH